ncbi:uncharacterized protein LOC130629453 isoform X2 [Hydractinia symbiolongicarpus]|uniref:uncharacterized protein LOC130629453 isoform X2 n=1 Tax=Hydractinia symbiolongicarpus TaxID=13093 RepID=UPI00254F9C19|nr:uncharacterized protein LOC130629453 isoform X2 [Hydractinia symbiolongicarpus]
MDYERLLLAYKLSVEFKEKREDGELFCQWVLNDDNKPLEIFAKTSRTEDPVIECVCEWFLKKKKNISIAEIIKEVNKCLKKCGRGLEITEDDLKHSFQDTEGGIQDEFANNTTSPSYMLIKNCNGNLVVQIEDNSFWSIQSVKSVNVEIDYIVERKEGKLMLLIHSQTPDSTNLSITLVDNERKIQLITIQGNNLAHQCTTTNHLIIITHNSCKICNDIESIVNTPTEETVVEFFCGGNLQRMTEADYEKIEKGYIYEYFTRDEKSMEEALQFPPPMLDLKCSVFAQRIKAVMVKSKHRLFTVLTHYDAKKHMEFLKLHKVFPVKSFSDENRILFVFLNTIINMRYTETTNAMIIQKEILAGEENLRELCIVYKKYLKNSNLRIINVVAAPNFEDKQDTAICVDCKIIFRNTWSEDKAIMKFFLNILQGESNICNKKEQYINIVSKIFCFMATRTALYSVPSLSDNTHEKITSLLLTCQQQRILYDKSKKKIITGSLGSGKTVLALSHLERAYQISETNSVIYYVIWDDKTLLKQDVASHANKFNNKANVTVLVREVVELAKDLKMTNVPAPSLLLISLVEKHTNENLHVIIDELNGEVLDKEESSSLKHCLETESRLQDSLVIIFPQSVEKHRTFISDESITNHYKYNYKDTGMKLFKLTRGMRASRAIFNFLKAFEQKAAKERTVIKLPVRQSHLKNDAVISPGNIDIRNNSREQEQPIVEEQLPQVVPHTTASAEEKEEESFKIPVDIDVIAASMNDTELSEHCRTEIELTFNSADNIGHNIKGTKPLLIHPVMQQMTEETVILLLAFALKDIGLFDKNRSLLIYNTLHQMTILYRLLKLLEIDFFHYDDSTKWKIRKIQTGEIVQDLSNYTNYAMLTTTQGARGIEAAECICIIDKDDCKLKHLTIEGMSRATQSLILLSMSNINKSNMLKSSTGKIVSELMSEYLIECCLEHSDDNETEIPFTKTLYDNKRTYSIHTQSWEYEEMMEKLNHVECPRTSEIKNANELIVKNLHPPEISDNTICSYVSDTTCELSWENKGYRYTIKKQDNENLDWKIVASNITSNKFVLNDMVIGELYKFCVVASNQVGKSDDNIVPYLHKLSSTSDIMVEDIEEIIESNDIEKLKKLLSIHPNIVHMRDERENTPLMWTVLHTDNTSMVEILISYGSDVWAEDSWKQNSYHFAASEDRHTILDMLCRHDVTNINRGDVDNYTPLHDAALRGHISCVDVLLRYENIDVTIKDIFGNTAYDWAGGWKNEQNRKIIRRKIKEYEARKK